MTTVFRGNCSSSSMVDYYPTAVNYLRKLRGGSQAHLIQADDGHSYAMKSAGNPQGTRVLVNEYLGSKVFSKMGIATAMATPIAVTDHFLNSNPEMGFILGSSRIPLRPGLHVGSRYEVPPDKVAIYDFIPDVLLSTVNNRDDFLGAFIADQWLSNNDRRQFVFYRDGMAVDPSTKRGFRAVAIDHGFCFGGVGWSLFDSPLTGIYFQQTIYQSASALQLESWLQRLSTIGEERLFAWVSDIPSDWLTAERPALTELIARLLKRMQRISTLVETAIEARPQCFPSLCKGKTEGYSGATRSRKSLPISA